MLKSIILLATQCGRLGNLVYLFSAQMAANNIVMSQRKLSAKNQLVPMEAGQVPFADSTILYLTERSTFGLQQNVVNLWLTSLILTLEQLLARLKLV
jgi:hypothetical protein